MSTHDELVAFAEKAAHDLNNPLTAISMSIEMALDDVPVDSEPAVLMQRALRSLGKLAATINDLPDRAAAWEFDD